VIRPAALDELPRLRDIERLAGERFRSVGMADVADNDPMSVDVLAGFVSEERCWVAVDEADEPIGYVIADVVDGNAHVEQVSVRPDRQGRGIGRALLERVRDWGAENGMPVVTLTTFRDVSWNGPLYHHVGFRILGEDEIGPELRHLRDGEAAMGLDPLKRVCMRWG
jgi:GNAT superfamily N-acetyltransferase